MSQKHSITLFWDSRGLDAKNESRIYLTVNMNRTQFRILLDIRATKVDFDKAVSSSRIVSKHVRELKTKMNDYLLKAETIFHRLQQPTKDAFIRLFKTESNLFVYNKTNVYFFFTEKMEGLKAEGRIGSYKHLKGSMANLQRYAPKLHFEEITEKWLHDYTTYLKNRGNSASTISIRIRCLRSIYNIALKQGFIPAHNKPFEHINTGSAIKSKSVLYPYQLKQFWHYNPATDWERKAKATWFFLYLANGMNHKDMAYLKYSDIKNESFSFVRQKTKFTSQNAKDIRVYLHDELKRIISIYGNTNKDGYVFPILNNCTDDLHKEETRCRYKKKCNKALAAIGKKLGFDVHLCLGLARHSYATKMKIDGIPVSAISDALGHTSTTTTEHYLKSLPDIQLKAMANKLLLFDNE